MLVLRERTTMFTLSVPLQSKRSWVLAHAVPTSYFCDPYASWQKGVSENTNGRLRPDLPHGSNINAMGRKEVDETLENYSMTPQKNSTGVRLLRLSLKIYIVLHFNNKDSLIYVKVGKNYIHCVSVILIKTPHMSLFL